MSNKYFKKLSVIKLSTDFREATKIVEQPLIPPNDDLVLVKVVYAGVNASDIIVTAGRYVTNGKLPYDIGYEALGTIEELGKSVTGLKVGQPVIVFVFIFAPRAYSEYLYAKPHEIFRVPALKPEFISLFTSGLTVTIGLDQSGRIQKGDKVLITAAAGDLESDYKSNRINEIRKKVLNYFLSNPNLAYESDIDVVANYDWLIEKFLFSLYKNNDPAQSLIASLKAWKNDNIQELNDTSFPSEFYALGHTYDFGAAKDGTALIGGDIVCAPPISKIDTIIAELYRKFIRYTIRKIIFRTGAKNFIQYSYFGEPNIMDSDIASMKEHLNTLSVHYPQYPSITIVYKLHGGFVTIIKALFTSLIPNYETILKFIDSEAEFEQYISLDQVPSHIGGRNKNFGFIPIGVKSIKCKHLPQFNQNPTDKKNWEFLKDIRIDCYIKTLQSTGITSLEEYLREC